MRSGSSQVNKPYVMNQYSSKKKNKFHIDKKREHLINLKVFDDIGIIVEKWVQPTCTGKVTRSRLYTFLLRNN